MADRFFAFYRLAKPGIIYGNAVSLLGGFFLAERGPVAWRLLALTLIGASLVIGSGCVFNNILDRKRDRIMERTKGRALASGSVSVASALLYGTALGAAGFGILAHQVNYAAAGAAAIGWVVYVVCYSALAKPRTPYATQLGAVAGAMPPVIGYAAAGGAFDAGALIVFCMLYFWQMPHFYAIAVYRAREYAAAGFPTFPERYGARRAFADMLAYIVLFALASAALFFAGYAGLFYLAGVAAASAAWAALTARAFLTRDFARAARASFFFSLIVLLAACALMAVDGRAPASARAPSASAALL